MDAPDFHQFPTSYTKSWGRLDQADSKSKSSPRRGTQTKENRPLKRRRDMEPQFFKKFPMSSTRAKIVIAVLVSPFVLFGISSALALDSGSVAKVATVDSPSGTRIDTPDSPSSIAGKTWADLGAEEFAALPADTQIVDCAPTQKRMQPGAVSSNSAGPSLNPGLHFLIDGRCAYDPSAIAKPFREDSVDGTSTKGMWEWTPINAVDLSSLPADTQIVNCWGDIKELPSGVRLQVGKNFAKEHPDFHFLTDGRCALSPNAISTSAETLPNTYDLQWFGTGLAGTPSVGSSSCFGGDPLKNHCGIETNITAPGQMPPGRPLPPILSAR